MGKVSFKVLVVGIFLFTSCYASVPSLGDAAQQEGHSCCCSVSLDNLVNKCTNCSCAQSADKTLSFEELKETYEKENAWGLLSSIDLKNCDPEFIRSAEKIKQYVVELCELIEMKRFGDCQVVHFGEDEVVAGFSMTQLIETSLISGHFANLTNSAYIDVFSCKIYDPQVVAEFTKKFFKADSCIVTKLLRK